MVMVGEILMEMYLNGVSLKKVNIIVDNDQLRPD